MESDSTGELDFAAFCRVAQDEWRQVVNHNETGVTVRIDPLTFEDIWAGSTATASGDHETFRWTDLLNPLPDPHVDAWGYAMTYPDHQKETRIENVFHFRKFGPAVSATANIVFRPHLDYEAEIGILIQRDHPHRFGYILVNDWTDRGIQARNYDADDMAPGFTAAKSFANALHVGYLLVIGNADVWAKLEIVLYVNGKKRQHLAARECLLRPNRAFNEIFKKKEAGEWAFVATGTTGGVQFQTPTLWQKIGLMLTSGFSRKRATEKWLAHLSFLQPGDKVELHSAILGRSTAIVVEE